MNLHLERDKIIIAVKVELEIVFGNQPHPVFLPPILTISQFSITFSRGKRGKE